MSVPKSREPGSGGIRHVNVRGNETIIIHSRGRGGGPRPVFRGRGRGRGRGHQGPKGESGTLSSNTSLFGEAETFAGKVSQLGTEPIRAIGHSVGGVIALPAAAAASATSLVPGMEPVTKVLKGLEIGAKVVGGGVITAPAAATQAGVEGLNRAIGSAVSATKNSLSIVICLMALLVMLPGGMTEKIYASHVYTNDEVCRITNCCNGDEIYGCITGRCLTAIGCVICEQADNQGICWEMEALGLSTRPGTLAITHTVQQWAGVIVWVGMLCDTLGWGEACSAAFVLGDIASLHFLTHPNINMTLDCELYVSDGASTFSVFWNLAGASKPFELLTYIAKIPSAIISFLLTGDMLVLFFIIYNLFVGRVMKALLLILLIGAVYGKHCPLNLPYGLNCSQCEIKNPGRYSHIYNFFDTCIFESTAGACNITRDKKCATEVGTWYNYTGTIYTGSTLFFDDKPFVKARGKCRKSIKSTKQLNIYCVGKDGKWFYHYGNFTGLENTNLLCTINSSSAPVESVTCISGVPRCKDEKIYHAKLCKEKRRYYTYERCGVTNVLSDFAYAVNYKSWVDCYNNMSRAGVIRAGYYSVPYDTGVKASCDQKIVSVKCTTIPNDTPLITLPMPCFSVPFTTSKTRTCKGYAWPQGDILRGLVLVDKVTREYQFFASTQSTQQYHLLEHTILVCIVLMLMGSKYVVILYFLYAMQISQIGAALPKTLTSAMVGVYASNVELMDLFYILIMFIVIIYEERLIFFVLFNIKMYYHLFFYCVIGIYYQFCPWPSVLGSEICVYVPDFWGSYRTDVVFGLCIFMMCFLTSFISARGKMIRLIIFARVHYQIQRFSISCQENWISNLEGKKYKHVIAFLLGYFFPREVMQCLIFVFFFFIFLDFVIYTVYSWCLIKPNIVLAVELLDVISKINDKAIWLMKWQKVTREAKVSVFDHLGHLLVETKSKLQSVVISLDPVTIKEEELQIIIDDTYRLACGDFVDGKPVVARKGKLIQLGCNGTLAQGFLPTAPIRLLASKRESLFSVIGSSASGVRKKPMTGHIANLRTPLGSCMGYGIDGAMMTCVHGTKGRTVATPKGATSALVVDAPSDIATYPAPSGLGMLTSCTSGCRSAYYPTRDGKIYEVVKTIKPGVWNFVSAIPLREAKGSSGGPLLCGEGKVLGTIVRVVATRTTAVAAIVVPLEKVSDMIPNIQPSIITIPKVTEKYTVASIVAPTGSGKSTRLPYSYVEEGKKVLVLNPSVATIHSMGPYMTQNYNIPVSVMHGGYSNVIGEAKLTYCTYGKFAVDPMILKGFDVVICDECHSTDSTSILGMGLVISNAEMCGVKLVLLATATPPGTTVSPHPDIEEEELGEEGDIDFYNKKLSSVNYKKGRHLIFCHSKTVCEELAEAFRSAGCNAIFYYRGIPISAIPQTGDVVICATDALMTGYTGDFDTVTDCNMSTAECMTVDLQPTFTIGVRSTVHDTVNRLQRRGRCGRGRKGKYFYCIKRAVPRGNVPDCSVLGAYEDGILWYNITPEKMTTLLQNYSNTVGLPTVTCDLEFMERLIDFYKKFRKAPETLRAQQMGFSHPLLTGAQAVVSVRENAKLPGTTGRWEGFKQGPNKCPLLCTLDVETIDIHYNNLETKELEKRLGYDRSEEVSWTLAAAAGVTVGVLILNITGSLVPTDGLTVLCGAQMAEKASTIFLNEDFQFEEEVSWDLNVDLGAIVHKAGTAYEGARKQALRAARYVGELGVEQRTSSFLSSAILAPLGLTACTFLSATNNPALSTMTAAAAALISPLGLGQTAVVALFGSTIISCFTSSKTGTGIAIGALAGAAASELGVAEMLLSIITGYGAASTCAHVTFDLMIGKAPSGQDLAQCLLGLSNLGAAIAGITCGVLLAKMTNPSSSNWTNRLLAMMVKGNVLPDSYFLDAKKAEEQISALLNAMTPVSLFNRLGTWMRQAEEIDVSLGMELLPEVFKGAWEYGSEFVRTRPWEKIWRFILIVWDFIKNLAAKYLPSFSLKLPLLNCTTRVVSKWVGTGSAEWTCNCGAHIQVTIADGKEQTRSSSKRLCFSAAGGTVFNLTTKFLGVDHVHRINNGDIYTYRYATAEDSYIDLMLTESGVVIVGSDILYLTVVGVLEAVSRQPLLENGVPIAKWRKIPGRRYNTGAILDYSGTAITLPHKIKAVTTKTDPNADPGSDWFKVPWKEIGPVKVNTPQKLEEVKSTIAEEMVPQKEGDGKKFNVEDLPTQGTVEKSEETTEISYDEAFYVVGNESELTEFAKWMNVPDWRWEANVPYYQFELIRNSKYYVLTTPETFEFELIKGKATGEAKLYDAGFSTVYRMMKPKGQLLAAEEADELKKEQNLITIFVTKDPIGGAVLKAKDHLVIRPDEFAGLCDGLKLPRTTGRKMSVDWSYTWDIMNFAITSTRNPIIPVRMKTAWLRGDRANVAFTKESDLGERLKKVTIQRPEKLPEFVVRAYEKAATQVSKMNLPELTYEEAVTLLHNKTAKSRKGYGAKEAKEGKAKEHVMELEAKLYSPEPYREDFSCTIMPKHELQLNTGKPPRAICYPDLGVRILEKMILGNAVKQVPEAILGESYGFVPPRVKLKRLIKWYQQKRKPFVLSLDVSKMDSNVTPTDMQFEAEIFKAASSPGNRTAIQLLHDKVYKSGDLYYRGRKVGTRNCRASGVLTTSAGNTISHYIKLEACLKELGVKADKIIQGDDVTMVMEKPDNPTEFVDKLIGLLNATGLTQQVPMIGSSLEDVGTSMIVKSVLVDDKPKYYIGREPYKPLATSMAETTEGNPECRWLGLLIEHYPEPWASRVLAISLLNSLLEFNKETISFKYLGNIYEISLENLPLLLTALHGDWIWKFENHPRQVNITAQALKDLGLPPLKGWYRRALRLRVACLRKGGIYRYLAKYLLHFTTKNVEYPSPFPFKDKQNALELLYKSVPYSNVVTYLEIVKSKNFVSEMLLGAIVFFLCAYIFKTV
nr:polyprotein [Hepacivirus sp.]